MHSQIACFDSSPFSGKILRPRMDSPGGVSMGWFVLRPRWGWSIPDKPVVGRFARSLCLASWCGYRRLLPRVVDSFSGANPCLRLSEIRCGTGERKHEAASGCRCSRDRQQLRSRQQPLPIVYGRLAIGSLSPSPSGAAGYTRLEAGSCVTGEHSERVGRPARLRRLFGR